MNIILQMSFTKPWKRLLSWDEIIFLSEDVDIILKKTLKVAYLLYLNEIGKIKRVFNPPKKPKIS